MAQPRGGPMRTGHASHQSGLDADIWLRPMPEQRYTLQEREELPSLLVVRSDKLDIDEKAWTPRHLDMLRAVAEKPQVQRIFVNPAIKKALCRDAGGDRACAMEVSSHALVLERVAYTTFAAALFTNLTRDHLDFHGDMQQYFAAKRRLFEMLPPGAPALVNVDDPRGAAMAEAAWAWVASSALRLTHSSASVAYSLAFKVSRFMWLLLSRACLRRISAGRQPAAPCVRRIEIRQPVAYLKRRPSKEGGRARRIFPATPASAYGY
mgnify:CR=1 FL=1